MGGHSVVAVGQSLGAITPSNYHTYLPTCVHPSLLFLLLMCCVALLWMGGIELCSGVIVEVLAALHKDVVRDGMEFSRLAELRIGRCINGTIQCLLLGLPR